MQLKKFAEQDPVNIKAAEKMGKLHDELETIGYTAMHWNFIWCGWCSACLQMIPAFSAKVFRGLYKEQNKC